MRVALIPARGGSQRIPGKNIREFHGKPIIAYSIETAIKSGLFDVVYVSTEAPEIAAIAYDARANIIRRPAEYAANDVGTQEVVANALETLQRNGIRPEYACCIYATAPLMKPEDLQDGWRRLMQVNPAPHFVYSVDPDGKDAGQWYWGRTDAFISRIPLSPIHAQVKKLIIPAKRVCDINVEEDWIRAEQLYTEMQA